MDRGLQSARRTGDDPAGDEHDPAQAGAAARVLNESRRPDAHGAVVRVAVGVAPIRARFAAERPPVSDDEWDCTAYVEQRMNAYREALAAHPGVRVDRLAEAPATQPAPALRCPSTGDLVFIEVQPHPVESGEDGPASLRAAIDRAVRRVFADRSAWRRHLLPAWFERHRAWRAEAGSPIQH